METIYSFETSVELHDVIPQKIILSNYPIVACVFVTVGTSSLSNGDLFWLHYSDFQALGGDTQTTR
jgi:hypothetical protein